MQLRDIRELETVFRASVLFKFGGSDDADVFLGSPVMAEALRHMLDSIEEHWSSSGNARRAESWSELYRVSKIERHVELISSYALRHPKWASMTRLEQLDWLQVITSPYRMDDSGIELFERILAK